MALSEPMHPYEGIGRTGLQNRFWRKQQSVVGTNLSAMTVMGNNGTNYVIMDPNAVDGSENVAGILLDPVNSATPVPAIVGMEYFDVTADSLVWIAGITGPQRTAALAQLEALNIRVTGVDVG